LVCCLLGLGLFLGVILARLTVGKRSTAVIEFANVAGMRAVVRYRGVDVALSAIRPGANGVEVDMEITPADVIIPRDVLVEATSPV